MHDGRGADGALGLGGVWPRVGPPMRYQNLLLMSPAESSVVSFQLRPF